MVTGEDRGTSCPCNSQRRKGKREGREGGWEDAGCFGEGEWSRGERSGATRPAVQLPAAGRSASLKRERGRGVPERRAPRGLAPAAGRPHGAQPEPPRSLPALTSGAGGSVPKAARPAQATVDDDRGGGPGAGVRGGGRARGTFARPRPLGPGSSPGRGRCARLAEARRGTAAGAEGRRALGGPQARCECAGGGPGAGLPPRPPEGPE